MFSGSRPNFAAVLIAMCALTLDAQVPELTKGTYVTHPAEAPAVTVSVTLGEDGKVTVKLDKETMVEGKYGLKGNRIEFLDQSGPLACPANQNGIYTWKFDGKTLTFTVIDDKCEARQNALATQVWTLNRAPSTEAKSDPPRRLVVR